MNKINAVLILLIFAFVFGCEDNPESKLDLDEGLLSLSTEIEEMIGPLTCTVDSDCQSIAYGDKPCGGPWSYLIVSTVTTNLTLLKQKVAQYNQLEAQKNLEEELVSTCDFVSSPDLACVEGMCQDLDR